MGRKKRAKLGDIIAIPIDEQKNSYAQLIAGEIIGCYVAYDIIAEQHPPVKKILECPIIFLAFTNDKFIADGHWKVIGNSCTPIDVIIPEFKVDVMKNGIIQCMVTSYDGKILRQATESEINSLNTMKSYTPNVLENAIKAKYGIIPWESYYDELLYKPSTSSADA